MGKKKTLKIKIKYFDGAAEISKIDIGNWIDLRSNKELFLKAGDFCLIPLGVAMELPKKYEAHIVPRSSTFKKWGLVQTNSVGIIDNSYCGDDDQWMFPVMATRDIHIEKNSRVCQFRIFKTQPRIDFVQTSVLRNDNRGGFGSTGHK